MLLVVNFSSGLGAGGGICKMLSQVAREALAGITATMKSAPAC